MDAVVTFLFDVYSWFWDELIGEAHERFGVVGGILAFLSPFAIIGGGLWWALS